MFRRRWGVRWSFPDGEPPRILQHRFYTKRGAEWMAERLRNSPYFTAEVVKLDKTSRKR